MRPVPQKVIWLLQYVAVRVVEMVLRCFPIKANLATARYAGDVLYVLDRRHRKVALGNLRASFPGASEKTIRRVARQSFEHMIMVGAEFLCMPRLTHFNAFTRCVEFGPRLEDALGLFASKRPCIIAGAHFGNWEVAAYMLASMGTPPTSVGRPLDNPYLDRHVRTLREKTGQKILSKFGMTGEAIDRLREGAILAFPADQDAGRRGFFVEFFGRKASAYKSIAYLALEEGVPIVVGGAYRTERLSVFRAMVTDIIDPTEYEEGVDAAIAITQRYTKALERLICYAPEQYLWVHRRWKTRPPEERKAKAKAR